MSDDDDPVTNGYLRQCLEPYATKEDLERFATKEDLERFATKEDLARLEAKLDVVVDVLVERIDTVVARHIGTMEEKARAEYGALDDKHTLRADGLRAQLDAHASDPDAHRRG